MDPTLSDGPSYSASSDELLQCGFRYAFSLSQDLHDAEDLVQEAWLRLSRHYGLVSSRGLLFVTIRNLFIDQTRRQRGLAFVALEETERELQAPIRNSTAAGDLAAMLCTLRPIEREALYLHHVEGHTAEEISKLTGTPRNTVLSLLSRALKKLQVSQID